MSTKADTGHLKENFKSIFLLENLCFAKLEILERKTSFTTLSPI